MAGERIGFNAMWGTDTEWSSAAAGKENRIVEWIRRLRERERARGGRGGKQPEEISGVEEERVVGEGAATKGPGQKPRGLPLTSPPAGAHADLATLPTPMWYLYYDI